MAGEGRRAARRAKARERHQAATVRRIGVVTSVVDATHVVVDGEIPAVVPASVFGVAGGSTVRLQMGGTPVVESVLSGTRGIELFATTSPAGSGYISNLGGKEREIYWASSGNLSAGVRYEITTVAEQHRPGTLAVLPCAGGVYADRPANGRLSADGVLSVRNNFDSAAPVVIYGRYTTL